MGLLKNQSFLKSYIINSKTEEAKFSIVRKTNQFTFIAMVFEIYQFNCSNPNTEIFPQIRTLEAETFKTLQGLRLNNGLGFTLAKWWSEIRVCIKYTPVFGFDNLIKQSLFLCWYVCVCVCV